MVLYDLLLNRVIRVNATKKISYVKQKKLQPKERFVCILSTKKITSCTTTILSSSHIATYYYLSTQHPSHIAVVRL